MSLAEVSQLKKKTLWAEVSRAEMTLALMHDRQANSHTKRFPAIYFLEKTRTKLLAMPPKKSTRQNSKVAESEDVIETEVSRPAFQAKDATQWMMFMSGKALFRVRP